ncbi:hypothetical protein [Paeniglutamicibacter kerguelensis]|uniref:Uncharacterized protein n=1 Tax=Paeniglutamicibacter kerguelensis TaxID=254788 RepID=A0ABS4XGZ3_9MICC|nr:hypothetical protein [Paeniglutamicibacter kerguelensis]MBP2386964.1 hypothetical protein [Paeniglutamicibacter kerguelensis]
MSQLTATGVGLAVSAALLYVVLRFFVANPAARDSTKAISSHALWTAAIAFLATGTAGLANLWANPDPNYPSETSAPALVMHAAAPGIWLGIIYTLGQFTWPRHLKPVRSASLEVRSIKTVIPKFLAGLLLVCTVISNVAIVFAWSDPGAPSRVGTESFSSYDQTYIDGVPVDEDGYPVDEYGNLLDEEEAEEAADQPFVPSITGTRPGTVVGPYLLGGLALVLASVAAVTALVVRRPPLDALDDEGNSVLRTTWINRLLRTAIIIVGGFGAASVTYMAESMSARAEWAIPVSDPGAGFDLAVQDQTNALNMTTTLCMLLLVIIVLACRPPSLNHVSPGTATRLTDSPSAAYSTARDFLLLAQCASIVALAFLGMLPAWTTGYTESQTWEVVNVDGQGVQNLISSSGPTRLAELSSFAISMLIVIVGYFLIQALAAYVVSNRLGNGTSLEKPRTDLLPHWFTVVLAVALTTALASIATFLLKGLPTLAAAAWWMLGLLLLAGLSALTLFRMAAGRPALREVGIREDHDLRVVVAHRGARMLGGVAFFIAGILGTPRYWVPANAVHGQGIDPELDASGFQIVCLILGAVLCILPAATAYRSPMPNTNGLSVSQR